MYVFTEACPKGWSAFNNSCYYVMCFGILKNWSEARKSCLNRNSDLVSIASQGEDSFVVAYRKDRNVSRTPTWIGLQQNDTSVLVWSDGSDLTYVNSNLSMVSLSLPKCVYVVKNQWTTTNCSSGERCAVCKRKG